tara:strand:+ start:775 stop:1014 length:240 start_codon:yes stop_codon:yes gene_type:complete
MKTFNASDMAHKRTEIFQAAKEDGAIIQKKNTNGVVLEEFVMIRNDGPAIAALEDEHYECDNMDCALCKPYRVNFCPLS